MARRGRRRKSGPREPNGRLKRKSRAVVEFDRGTPRAQAMREIYGQDATDAIGRAYRKGLLGEGQDAKAMLDTARKISNAYWAAYRVGGTFCTLADRYGGSNSHRIPEDDHRRQEWLEWCIDTANTYGSAHRYAFDQLCIDPHPDSGPVWLDRLIAKAPVQQDIIMLDRALELLGMVAGVDRQERRAA